jgi:hypothetical protein
MSPEQNKSHNQSLLPEENEMVSLLALHSQLLDGANIRKSDALHAEAVQVSQTRIGLARLSPVSAQMRKGIKPASWLIGICSIAAAIMLLIFNPSPHSDLNIKGSQKIFLVVQRSSGERVIWDDKTPLGVGDRFNAEIISDAESQAFYAVYNRRGELLSSHKSIEDNQLLLQPAVSGFFPEAIELDGTNEGEEVVIAVCRRNMLSTKFPRIESFVQLAFSRNKLESIYENFAAYCEFETKRLR